MVVADAADLIVDLGDERDLIDVLVFAGPHPLVGHFGEFALLRDRVDQFGQLRILVGRAGSTVRDTSDRVVDSVRFRRLTDEELLNMAKRGQGRTDEKEGNDA